MRVRPFHVTRNHAPSRADVYCVVGTYSAYILLRYTMQYTRVPICVVCMRGVCDPSVATANRLRARLRTLLLVRFVGPDPTGAVASGIKNENHPLRYGLVRALTNDNVILQSYRD